MINKRSGRWTVASFAVVAVALLLASTAYACTTFRGKLTVTGTGGTTSVAEGDGGSMNWCSTPTDDATVNDSSSTETVTVSVVETPVAGSCNGSTTNRRLPNGEYDIRWGTGIWDNGSNLNDCMFDTKINSLSEGTFTITNGVGGATSGPFQPNGGASGMIGICVMNGGSTYGLQTHLQVL